MVSENVYTTMLYFTRKELADLEQMFDEHLNNPGFHDTAERMLRQIEHYKEAMNW